MTPMLRDYQPADAEAIVRVALAAFAQFEQDDADHDGRAADVSADGICQGSRGTGYFGRAVCGL
jgi:hypothetical protein